MCKAVQLDGLALQCASDMLREDIELVRPAVTQNPRALEHASNSAASHLVRDTTLLQTHFQDHLVIIITTLSGNSCVHVDDGMLWEAPTKRQLVSMAYTKLNIPPEHEEQAELLLGRELVPNGTCDTWPGVYRGTLTELQLIVQEPFEEHSSS
eukprot:468656-Amphidinium_carterae.1